MAEGFARRYGSDVMEPASAGLAPASVVQPLTKKVMSAKNIHIDAQYPKNLETIDIRSFDLIVNMSGATLPTTRLPIETREWRVEDPIGQSEEIYCSIRDQIENDVMRLILELRKEARHSSGNGSLRPGFNRARARN